MLDLSLNEMLLPKSFTWSKYTESGDLVTHKPTQKVKHFDVNRSVFSLAIGVTRIFDWEGLN